MMRIGMMRKYLRIFANEIKINKAGVYAFLRRSKEAEDMLFEHFAN